MSIGVLDKAFLSVHRAMPFGFALSCLGWRNGIWVAEARPVMTRGYRSWRETTGHKPSKGKPALVQADGVTPQEAMDNLADALDAFRENGGRSRQHDAIDDVIHAVFGEAT